MNEKFVLVDNQFYISNYGRVKKLNTKPKNFVHNTPHSEDTKVKISIANSNKYKSLRNEVV